MRFASGRAGATRSLVPRDDTGGARRCSRFAETRVGRGLRGQSVIEFALALPVMLLIVMGAVDVGRVFFDYVGLRNAAMVGAIYGATHLSAEEGDVEDRVRGHFYPDPGPDRGDIEWERTDCTDVDQAGFSTVTISQEFQPITLDLLQFAGPGTDWVFTVSPTAQARCMT